MKKFIIFIFCVIGIQRSQAQQIEEKFTTAIEYLTYRPADYEQDTIKKWPLVVFIHGWGERGSDLEKVKIHGPPMLVDQGKEFPFILISPQAKDNWDDEFLYKMIVDFAKNNRVDTDRIYLTGLSTGGFVTWTLAQKHPELFAAIAPICGWGETQDLWKLRHMPVWVFHGAKDSVVPISSSQQKVDVLRTFNPEVKFTIYPEVEHGSWVKAYNDPELYKWLLAQKKFHYKKTTLSLDLLSKYTGKYHFKVANDKGDFHIILGNIVNDEGDFEIILENKALKIEMKGKTTTLFSFDEDRFFTEKRPNIEFEFSENEKGEIEGGRFFEKEMFIFKKFE